MSRDPAFLFYPNDYLGGTMGFSFEMHGAYLVLLIYQFNNGPFTPDTAAGLVGATLFESIRHKFDVLDTGCICNARLMQEIEKRQSFSESRRINAKKGWEKTKKVMHMHSTCNASAMHMGNENENRNISLSFPKEGVQGEITATVCKNDYSHNWQEFKCAYPANGSTVDPAAERAFHVACSTGSSPDAIIAAAAAYKAFWQAKEPTAFPHVAYISQAANWLSRRQWEIDWQKRLEVENKKPKKVKMGTNVWGSYDD
jgi:uncharacterized protein YdaU (DUF1376 family)